MKEGDIIISRKAVRRERWIALCCLVAAYIVNIITILVYRRPASELYSTVGYVLVFAIMLYLLLWIPRLLALLVKKIFCRK